MRKNILLTIVLLFTFARCTKIENLSQDTSLTSFEVVGHLPAEIILGDIEFSADSVYIHVEYGKYEFPLMVKVKARASAGAYIYGVEDKGLLTFESIDSPAHRFVVSAENGKSKNYFIALREVSLDESSELLDSVMFNEGDGEGTMMYNSLVATSQPSEKMIVAIGGEYPLSVTPRFEVAPTSTIESYRIEGSASWSPFVNGEREFTFNDADAGYEIEVVAQSGKREVWRIGSYVVDYSAIDATMQIDYRDLAASPVQSECEVERFDIDFESGEITIVVAECEGCKITFPLDFEVEVPVSEWLTLVGLSFATPCTFNSWDDEFNFSLFDKAQLKATEWSLKIKKYEPRVESVVVESASIDEFTTGVYKYFFSYNHLTTSTTRTEPAIYPSRREVLIYYKSFYMPVLSSSSIPDWWAQYDLNLSLSDGSQSAKQLRWEAVPSESGKITQTEIKAAVASVVHFDVAQADGSVEEWSARLVKDDVAQSSECELLDFKVESTLPNYVSFADPLYTLDDGASMIYLNIGERYNFPMRVNLECQVSEYASVEPTELYFADEFGEQTITVTAQDGVTQRSYTVKLIVPQSAVAPEIESVEFGDMVGAEHVGQSIIDAANRKVTIGVEATSKSFPLDIPIENVVVGDGGSFDLPVSGAITFSSADSRAMVWVSSSDGTAREMWSFELFYYEQIAGGDMDSWELSASPVTASLPWSTPNMSGIASVKNTTPVAGESGAEGDFAAQMSTGTSWGQLAAGSIFTGWFDKDNSTSLGLSDPVRLTHFGIPFSPDAKIKGVSAKVSYAQAAGKVDWGSLTVILINHTSSAAFEFHGNKPNDYDDPKQGSAPHPMNTAVAVVTKKLIFGNGSASATTYGEEIDMNLEAGEWREIFIPLATDEPFTHISVAAASSAYGDYFIGEVGSVMRLDSVKIIYE